jgi:hypothetical protein
MPYFSGPHDPAKERSQGYVASVGIHQIPLPAAPAPNTAFPARDARRAIAGTCSAKGIKRV